MVKEYLLLALADPAALRQQFRSILAITFTNKAAAEMKERIIKALRELSAPSDQKPGDLGSTLQQELHISREELSKRAGIVLTEILHHYSDFSIGTIDSFTHRIIRTFATDLKLPVNFQIETDVNHVFGKIVALLLNDLGRNKALTDYLIQYSLSQAEDNKNWNPEQGLLQFINDIYKEGKTGIVRSLQQFSIADFDRVRKNVLSDIKAYQQSLKQPGEAALAAIAAQQVAPEDLYQGAKGIYSFFKKLAGGEKITFDELYNSNIQKTLEEDKWHGGKASGAAKAAIDGLKPQLKQLADQALDIVKAGEARYSLQQLIYKNIYAMGLVNELAKLTAQFKEEENILFISEFNERISAVVNGEPTPFIYERLGDRYQHYLVDEFQDTSILQWQNILPLLDNSLANGRLNLIVGDGKQSIYRWRNANVEQFINLPALAGSGDNDILHEREQTLARTIEHKLLDTNYRSRPEVVKFNNALFDHLAEQVLHEDFKKIYHQQAQKFKGGEAGGYVTIDFADDEELGRDEVNCAAVHNYILAAKADGYSYSDMCIIVRRNQSGNTLANYLIREGIPVVSSESLLLSSALEVNVLISFLKYLANEKDLVSASVVVNYLHVSGHLNDDGYTALLKELNLSKTKDLFDILAACALPMRKQQLQLKNLYDACIDISHLLGLNEANPVYVRFFLDEVLAFLGANTSNINLFAEWWERRADKASVVMPEGMDAVSIMTVHKSKGLEFPVVITPYMEGDLQKTEPIWVELEEEGLELEVALIDTSKTANYTRYKGLADRERQFQVLDHLNVLYVDFTRAVDRLHIISRKKDADPKDGVPKTIQAWLYGFARLQEGFDANKGQLLWGMPTPKQNEKAHASPNELKAGSLSFKHNSKAVEIKGGASYRVTEDLEKAREYGVLVHYILSQVNTPDDIEAAIRKALLNGDINEEEAVKISGDVGLLIMKPALKDYFMAGLQIKNECEILLETGEVLRPDRVVLSGNTAVVIDYKTGKRNPAKYHFQMKQYEEALQKLGYGQVKKFLVYIHEGEVEEVF